MPLASKSNGYPVEEKAAAAATVAPAVPNVLAPTSPPKTLKSSSGTEPTVKDRSIINQTAWKVVAMMSAAIANYNGSQEKFEEAVSALQLKIEKKMLSIYTEEKE